MSVAGRNASWRGSTVTFYRAERAKSPLGGGQQQTRWRALTGREAVKVELFPQTDEILRRVFGAEAAATLMAVVEFKPNATDPIPGDGVVVADGHYAGLRFLIAGALPFRRGTQIGLAETTEVIP